MIKFLYFTVLFAYDQIRKFNNNKIFTDEEVNEYCKFYEFETKIELNAFILKSEVANG